MKLTPVGQFMHGPLRAANTGPEIASKPPRKFTVTRAALSSLTQLRTQAGNSLFHPKLQRYALKQDQFVEADLDRFCRDVTRLQAEARAEIEPIYSTYGHNSRRALQNSFRSVVSDGEIPRRIALLGSGQNYLEVLLFARAFPQAHIDIYDPYQADWLQKHFDDWREAKQISVRMHERLHFHQVGFGTFPSDAPYDLLYGSGLLADDVVFWRHDEALKFIDALARSVRADGHVLLRGVHGRYHTALEAFGLNAYRSQTDGTKMRDFLMRKAEPVQNLFLTTPRAWERVIVSDRKVYWTTTRDQMAANDHFFIKLNYEIELVKIESRNILKLFWRHFDQLAEAFDVGIYQDPRDRTLHVQGPNGSPLWRLSLGNDGHVSLTLSQKFMELIAVYRRAHDAHMSSKPSDIFIEKHLHDVGGLIFSVFRALACAESDAHIQSLAFAGKDVRILYPGS